MGNFTEGRSFGYKGVRRDLVNGYTYYILSDKGRNLEITVTINGMLQTRRELIELSFSILLQTFYIPGHKFEDGK